MPLLCVEQHFLSSWDCRNNSMEVRLWVFDELPADIEAFLESDCTAEEPACIDYSLPKEAGAFEKRFVSWYRKAKGEQVTCLTSFCGPVYHVLLLTGF